MYYWGDNTLYQIGLGYASDSSYATPQAIPGLQ